MTTKSTIPVKVDFFNPGQFFACCGLLELADRLWPGAEGWFDARADGMFHIAHKDRKLDPGDLLAAIADCTLRNTMTDEQVRRREELSAIKEDDRKTMGLEEEKKALDSAWRERPLLFGDPFNLLIDWFLDARSGGDRFKTWAGQQSVLDIATKMKDAISETETKWRGGGSESWLQLSTDINAVPFNFDSNLGVSGLSLTVGFSLDKLKKHGRNHLLIELAAFTELAAFIGLQRFRPLPLPGKNNLYRYRVWHEPLSPPIASVAACTFLPLPSYSDFEFRLLYRTKYLKSFLPATQTGG